MQEKQNSVLIIYTGGTIGMIEDIETGALTPIDFSQISQQVPELQRFNITIDTISFDPVIDSSDINVEFWVKLAQTLKSNYEQYDGFVILHGTDTMSFTASMLSFMLENQSKPVILTGSQLPIGKIRTDGKENLITAIEVAAAKRGEHPIVPEVCIYFENKLYRGNRTTKHNAEYFDAFSSSNYPLLAEAGIKIKYNHKAIHQPTHHRRLKIHTQIDNNVAILKLFPGLNRNYVEAVLSTPALKGLVLETFGAGNAITDHWFVESLQKAIKSGLIIVNVTQCRAGSVIMGRYETSVKLKEIGVVSGYDITTEAAITKLMFLFGQNLEKEEIIEYLNDSISGEMTIFEE